MLSVKIWQCLHLFILRKIGQENEFHPILQRKNAFLEYKNNKFKKSKNWDFSKGVSPWFWSKMINFFHPFVFGKKRQEDVFHDILERKNVFQR